MPVLRWCIRLLRFSLNKKDTPSGIYVLASREYGEGISEKKAKEIVCNSKPGASLLFDKMCGFSRICEELGDEEALFSYFELERYLNPVSASYMEDRDAVHRLFQIMFDYVKEQQENREAGMRAFINSSSLYGLDVLREEISEEKDSVKLMTLHASKGLEFSCVFITGVNYGLIPLKTRDMDGEEEERRLFFVGITRAKDRLELSYYTNPGERAMPGESRYIRMIPPRLLEGEEERGPAVSLQELKRQVQEQRTQVQERSLQEQKRSLQEQKRSLREQEPAPTKRVRHPRYGTGVVVREDETMLEAEFEGYGTKEFIKAFSELEYI